MTAILYVKAGMKCLAHKHLGPKAQRSWHVWTCLQHPGGLKGKDRVTRASSGQTSLLHHGAQSGYSLHHTVVASVRDRVHRGTERDDVLRILAQVGNRAARHLLLGRHNDALSLRDLKPAAVLADDAHHGRGVLLISEGADREAKTDLEDRGAAQTAGHKILTAGDKQAAGVTRNRLLLKGRELAAADVQILGEAVQELTGDRLIRGARWPSPCPRT